MEDSVLKTVLGFLTEHQYLAMFGILFLCGFGLPIPEEVTLIGSGLLVGWGEADFLWASVACVAGILAGDSVVFGMGYLIGPRFLNSRFMRLVNKEKVARFFAKHGNKALFFARFFAGVRIGVYAFAGTQRISWFRFLFLDFLGAMLSGPTSIWVGKWAAQKFAADKDHAIERAQEVVNEAGHWIVLGIVVLIVVYAAIKFGFGRRRKAGKTPSTKPPSLPIEKKSSDHTVV